MIPFWHTGKYILCFSRVTTIDSLVGLKNNKIMSLSDLIYENKFSYLSKIIDFASASFKETSQGWQIYKKFIYQGWLFYRIK